MSLNDFRDCFLALDYIRSRLIDAAKYKRLNPLVSNVYQTLLSNIYDFTREEANDIDAIKRRLQDFSDQAFKFFTNEDEYMMMFKSKAFLEGLEPIKGSVFVDKYIVPYSNAYKALELEGIAKRIPALPVDCDMPTIIRAFLRSPSDSVNPVDSILVEPNQIMYSEGDNMTVQSAKSRLVNSEATASATSYSYATKDAIYIVVRKKGITANLSLDVNLPPTVEDMIVVDGYVEVVNTIPGLEINGAVSVKPVYTIEDDGKYGGQLTLLSTTIGNAIPIDSYTKRNFSLTPTMKITSKNHTLNADQNTYILKITGCFVLTKCGLSKLVEFKRQQTEASAVYNFNFGRLTTQYVRSVASCSGDTIHSVVDSAYGDLMVEAIKLYTGGRYPNSVLPFNLDYDYTNLGATLQSIFAYGAPEANSELMSARHRIARSSVILAIMILNSICFTKL